MGGVDGYSCSAKAPKKACTDFLNYLGAQPTCRRPTTRPSTRRPVNKDAQAVVTEPYLKAVLDAFNNAPYVSQWLDTLYGQNVGNALNIAVVEPARRQGLGRRHHQGREQRGGEGLAAPT